MKNHINHKEKSHGHHKASDVSGIPHELNKADEVSSTHPPLRGGYPASLNIISEFEGILEPTAESPVVEAPDELQQKNEEIEALREQLKRMQAEFENFRRRQEKAMEEFRAYAAEKLVSELLPIVDNLQRAIKSAEESCSFESLLEGIKLVLRQMQDVLGKAGLKEIDTNSAFDPNFHEAVMRVESAEHPDEAIVEEFQKGYILGDKVLRPALVKVARSINGGEAASEEKNK